MKTKIIYSLLALCVLALSCKSRDTEKKEQEEVLPENIVEMRYDQISLAGIDTSSLEMRTLSGTLKVSGLVTVGPGSLASVSAPMGGFVQSSNLLPGKPVVKGQILARIENPDFIDLQQNYLESKSRLEVAEADYKRQNELIRTDATSKKALQQATSEYAILKTQARGLEQKLLLAGINPYKLTAEKISRTVALRAPISGYLKTVNVSVGKSVTSTDVLFEIVNTDKLLLELTLYEKDAAKVATGQNIHFFINNEQEQHDAVIYQTGNTINEDRSYKVYAGVVERCPNLIPGLYVNALISTKGDKSWVVPEKAVVRFEDKDYIFAFEKNKKEDGKDFTEYRMIPVTKGLTQGELTEIHLPADIVPAELKVVVKGAYNLLSAKKNAGEMAC